MFKPRQLSDQNLIDNQKPYNEASLLTTDIKPTQIITCCTVGYCQGEPDIIEIPPMIISAHPEATN